MSEESKQESSGGCFLFIIAAMIGAIAGMVLMAETLKYTGAKNFNFEGHTYLKFPDKGVVHHPECHCLKGGVK